MKKLISVFLLLTMVLTLTACGSKAPAAEDGTKAPATEAPETSAPAYDYLNAGKLTVGAEMSYSPFEMTADDGVTYIGYDVELAKALGEKLGVEVEFVNTAFDTIFEGIGTNYDVVISAVTINAEREENQLFSIPYIDNYQTVVVKKDSSLEFKSLTDLDGKSVAFQKGTTSDETIKDLIETGSVECTTVDNEKIIACFSQLDNGEVDTVLCDSSVAQIYASKNPDKYEIAFTDSENPEQFGIAMAKTNTDLKALIDDALTELKSEGFLDELNDRWFVEYAGADTAADTTPATEAETQA